MSGLIGFGEGYRSGYDSVGSSGTEAADLYQTLANHAFGCPCAHLPALGSSPFSVRAPLSREGHTSEVEGCQISSTGLKLGFANTGTDYSSHESNMPVSAGDLHVWAVPPLGGSGPGCREWQNRRQPGMQTTGTVRTDGGLWKSPDGVWGQHCDCKDAAGLNFKVQGMGRAGGHCKLLCLYPVCFWLKQWHPCLICNFSHKTSKINCGQ